jgi:hypothetical protein
MTRHAATAPTKGGLKRRLTWDEAHRVADCHRVTART